MWKAIITTDFFIRKLTISVYVACPLYNLKPLNYDHFIVNDQNNCI